MKTKNLILFFSFFLLISSYLSAQIAKSDVAVTVDYSNGTARVSWKDDPGSAGGNCRVYSFDEKITYRIGSGATQTLFDNTNGSSSGVNYADFNSLPANFFTEGGTINWEGKHGNANTGCANPLVYAYHSFPITTRVENPQSLSATFDGSCSDVTLNWLAPSIVSGSSNLRFDISRRTANTSAAFSNVATVNGNVTSYSDAAAPAGVEQEYKIQTKMLYSNGSRTAITSGASVNGRKIGVSGNPSGVFIDQANCSGALDVNWNWSNSNNPNNFEVYKSTSSTFASGVTTTVLSGSDRSYRDNSSVSGSQYYYRVRATATCPGTTTPLYSSYSNTDTQVGLGVPTAAATTSITVDTNNRRVTLNWTDNSLNEDGFKVVRQGPTGQVEFDVSENAVSYIDNSADICQNLTYSVKAYNSCRTTGVNSTNTQSAYIPANIAHVFDNTSNKAEASDGEFGDRIEVKWKTPTRQVDDWYIYRINPLIPDTTFVAAVEGKSRFYSDNTANANTLYNYLIEGVSDCAGNTLKSNNTKDIGFRLAFGTANGQVTYDGGTAVEGVKVTAEAASGASGFSGNFNGSSSYANANNPIKLKTDSMTIVSFIRPTNLTGKKVIASKRTGTTGWEFFLDGSTLKLTTGNKTISATSSFITAGNWVSVAASVSGSEVKLYARGILLNTEVSTQLSTNTATDFFIGKSITGDYFNGQIDEVRFYNRALSTQEIQRSYDVYINPSQNGLVGYWRFDEGFGGNAYDYSKTLLTPNKNHATLNNVTFNNSKPTTTQLTAGAYTDKRGSYFIPFIPYLGNGDNFIVTPAFGTHTFTPATTTLFIGGATPNFNNVNFTDNSSFTVTGSVKYKNSTCFVEGVFIKVDGAVVIQNGEPVRTKADGTYALQVPIGPHVLTAEKQSHGFSTGRFPANGNFNFQQNENLTPFIDSTLLTVVGRVAGGGIQADLVPGLGKGKNNIGRATIRFKSLQGAGCMDTSITTDPVTGEFTIGLPPLKFEIPDFRITSNNSIGFLNNTILDLFNAPPLQTETDSVFKDSVGIKRLERIDSIKFNKVLNFIHYQSPILNVVDKNFGLTGYGSDSVTVEVQRNNLTIPTNVLGLKYPIFEENSSYEWNIQAFEVYENKDGGATNSVFDSVPLTNGKFIINNQLAINPSKEIEIRPQDKFEGTENYKFSAGQANTSTDQLTPDYSFTKTFEITLVTPNATVKWQPNSGDGTPSPLFRGIIFGGRALGNSFATAGPQVVTMILRDPPGSESYASWEKEVSITTTSTFENSGGLGVQIQKGFNLGTKFSVGLGYQTETEIKNSLLSKTNIETSITGTNEYVEVTSNSIAINTSADPDFVGGEADLFFGRSINMDFGLSQLITLIDTAKCGDGNSECYGNVLSYNGNGFKIGSTKAMFTIPGGYGTEFIFTQAGIEGSVIPRLENLRNQLLTNNSNYQSFLNGSHANFGKSNDDQAFIGVGSGPTPEPGKNTTADSLGVSYHFKGYGTKDSTIAAGPLGIPSAKQITIVTGIDSVWWYNQQIRLWEQAIERNEREKVLANSNSLDRNISYQAGAGISYTTSTTRDTTDNLEIAFSLAEELTLKIAAEIGGNGIEVENNLNVNYSHTSSSSTTNSTATTFSYTIEDQDGGDDFSVDVFRSKDGYAPIFKTRGGQTACPYQGESKTKYFRPGTVLDKATIQLEQPRITATPSTVFNVPAQSSGVFTVNLINDGLEDQIYDLKVLENTNPNGAIIKIDGISPNRAFAVPAQTSITKQLQIEKGPTHIRYDSIALVFHSQCQYSFGTANAEDIADTVYISVQFLPACTDVQITSPGDQFVLNNTFKDTLPLLLSGYDINYGGFEKIGIQFKPSAQSSWIPLSEEWFVDTTNIKTRYPNHPAPYLIPRNQSYINYNFDMATLIDQSYQIRATATCKIPGNPDKNEFSTVVGGIADRVNPHPFGTPTPADGVLDPNDDISIQFNEPIEAGSITRDNFQLSGVVNGQEVRHDKTVSFDGATGYLEIANGFDFAANSFTIEFWAKRNTLGTNQVVISQGNTPNNLFAVGFNVNNNVEVTVGNQTTASSFTILDDTTWHHYSIIYDKPNLNLDIVDRSSSVTTTSTNNNFFSSFNSGGKTYFGKNSRTNSDFFDGSAHQIRIWNRALSSSVIASRLNVNLTGREAGLVGYWPMEEGRGVLAQDIARSRNAEVHAQWELSPKSSSVSFDGIDDYAILDSAGTLAASFEMDLTIEFWFKTSGGSTQTFLSNGGGRFTPNGSNRNGWNIEMAANNTIHVKNDSTDFVAVSKNFADNNWHHFALVVNRAANATAYIDGIQQNTLPSTNFYGFGAPKLAVGARYSVNGAIETIDQYFNGSIDEIRIWNSARLKDNLELDMFNRLTGNEFGLMVYYPFEGYKVSLGVPSLTPNFKDGSLSLLDLTPQNGAMVSAAQSPAIALQRPVKNVNFTWSVNNDKIVISTNEAPANIENVTLNISVKNIKDLHGNKMQSPKTWIAYINKNQVKWQDVEKNLKKEFNDTLTFTNRVINSGGEVKRFTISNIPAWLTVSPSNGVINPQSTKAIKFTVNPALNIGEYNEDLLLATDFGYNEKLSVKLDVKKTAPDFIFDKSLYAKSMNVIGQIAVNGNISVNDEDILVAYINGQIRGKTNLKYVANLDKYIGFLDVYSNLSDSITFKVWNASEGELHENVTPNLYFVENALVGSLLNPQIFNAVNNLAKPIVLNQGWNWVSFPLTDDKMRSLHAFFSGVNFQNGDVVKTIGNNSFAQYGGPALGWSGGLTRDGLNSKQSYLIHIATKDTLNYKGLAIDPDTMPINVLQGWNRIGFVSTKNIEINSALANYNATDGDLIKSQQAFAVYLSTLGWIGSLTTLEPTEGYLLKAANSNTFVYPRRGLLRLKEAPVQEKLLETLPALYTLNPHDFEASTNAIIKVNTCEEVLENQDWALAAFKGEELRGWVNSTKKVNDQLGSEYFITVFGEGNETYTFKMVNKITGEEMAITSKLDFEKNKVQGEVLNPLKFDLIKTIDCNQFKTDELLTETVGDRASFPNPFKNFLTIVVPSKISETGKMEILDQNGRIVFESAIGQNKQIFLNGAELYNFNNGVFQLKFIDGDTVISEKLVKIK